MGRRKNLTPYYLRMAEFMVAQNLYNCTLCSAISMNGEDTCCISDESCIRGIAKYLEEKNVLGEGYKPKKVNKHSLQEYLDAYREGKNIEDIANLFGVKAITVRNNLLSLYEVGLIGSTRFLSHPTKIHEDLIVSIIERVGYSRLSRIKDECPDYITYDDIAVVVSEYRYRNNIPCKKSKQLIQTLMGSRGTCMTISKFISCLEDGSICSCDGFGRYHDGYSEVDVPVSFDVGEVLVVKDKYPFVCWYNK